MDNVKCEIEDEDDATVTNRDLSSLCDIRHRLSHFLILILIVTHITHHHRHTLSDDAR
jgi:hypothetical protein